jgi:3-oxoacyl-[acyl-carrier-protein] synthase II
MSVSGLRRVVITGIGIVSPVGTGKDAFWQAIREGHLGIRGITLFDASTYPASVAGEISDFDAQDTLPHEVARRLDRYASMGMVASKLALEDSKLDLQYQHQDIEGACVRVGTVIGALSYAESAHRLFIEKGLKRLSPYFSSAVLPSSLAAQIGIEFGIHGSIATVTTACASGTSAIGEAFNLIRRGEFDLAIAGASEAPITPMVVASFGSVGLLATSGGDPTKACRPFSKDRPGIILGEGSAMVILEVMEHAIERGAHIYAEIVGHGETFDAYHTHHPLPSAKFLATAINRAIADASIQPATIDYVNVHGSGSLLNDKAETLGLKQVFGDHAYQLAISSTKSIIGHSLGACGALEFVACALMLERQYIHPTINLTERDPECDLDYVPNYGRNQRLETILKISNGFGGYNAACILRRFDPNH